MNLTYLEIDHQRSIYQNLADATGSEFMDRLVFSWLYHDHALEGVVLTSEDIQRAQRGLPARNYCDGVTQHSIRSLQAALSFIHESASRGDELSLDWLRELHCLLAMPGDEGAGRYRKRDTSPGVYHLDVSPANSISYYFHKFIDIYQTELADLHPIRAAAMTHWEFMKVFPFDERTGMVGRLMMNFLLLKRGFPPAIIHATDRHLYFNALGGHRTDMIPVVADAVRATLNAARAFQSAQLQRDRSVAAY